MLKSVRLENFFSFQDETIEFNPGINVLVGINGSGKSNLFKAFRLIKEGHQEGGLTNLLLKNWGGFSSIFNATINASIFDSIVLTFSFIPNKIVSDYEQKSLGIKISEIIYKIDITSMGNNNELGVYQEIVTAKIDGITTSILEITFGSVNFIAQPFTGQNNYTPFNSNSSLKFNTTNLNLSQVSSYHSILTNIKKFINKIDIYDTFDTTKSSEIRKPIFATTEKKLSSSGGNLVLVLNHIKNTDKGLFSHITESLSDINENFKGFDFNLVGGNIELMLDEKGLNRSIHVSHLSDGTLRYLCLLAIIFNNEHGQSSCIDEPETGLHPDMINSISSAFKKASESSQMIISTHSPILLNQFNVEDILIFEKDSNNSTKVKRHTSEDFTGWYEKFLPGQMWRNGDFGGNRW